MARASERDLLFVSKSGKAKLELLKAGESLVIRTGYTIDRLHEKAVKDRLDLARSHLQEANRAYSAVPPANRATISRAYYSMYHTARAVCFFHHEGDDYEEHKKLPGAIPDDFPSRAYWENQLKSARFERNRADYDPYPRNSSSLQSSATDLLSKATFLLTKARAYLRSKGCRL